MAFFCMIYGYNAINIILNYMFTLVIGQNSLDTMLQIGMLLLVTFYMFSYGIKRKRFANFAMMFVGIVALFKISSILFSNTAIYVNENLSSVCFCMLTIAPIFFIEETEWILDGFKIVGWLELIMSVLLALVVNGVLVIENAEVGYMVYGYKVLPAAIILLFFYFKEGNKKYGVGAILASLLILMFGSRGALVGVIVSTAVFMLVYDKERSTRKWAILIAGSVAVLLLKNEFFLVWLSHSLSDIFHFESRTLLKMIDGTADNDSGRSILIGMAKELLDGRWFIGYGLFGDRANLYLTEHKQMFASWFGEGFYVHNNFYEILLNFGVIPGIALIVALFISILKAIRHNEDNTKGIILICSCIAITSTIFSGSYLLNAYTYAMLASLIVYRREIDR